MLHKKVKLKFALLLSIAVTGLHAQDVIPVAGGNASGSGGTVSYTVGQVAYTTNSGSNGSIAQGIQQPYEISVTTEIEDTKDISLNCMAYPNPAKDYLILTVGYYIKTNLSYQLFDINGKLLENKNIENQETKIDLNLYAPSAYFLKVIVDRKEIKTFKIIKNQ